MVEVTGLDRLLRILPVCRPNATHSVPDYTLSPKNLPLAIFIDAETFSGSSPTKTKIKGTNLKADSFYLVEVTGLEPAASSSQSAV